MSNDIVPWAIGGTDLFQAMEATFRTPVMTIETGVTGARGPPFSPICYPIRTILSFFQHGPFQPLIR